MCEAATAASSAAAAAAPVHAHGVRRDRSGGCFLQRPRRAMRRFSRLPRRRESTRSASLRHSSHSPAVLLTILISRRQRPPSSSSSACSHTSPQDSTQDAFSTKCFVQQAVQPHTPADKQVAPNPQSHQQNERVPVTRRHAASGRAGSACLPCPEGDAAGVVWGGCGVWGKGQR
jgi:hypothetical protein